MSKRSIGVFDSGVGGLTVLKELKRQLPGENFIYLGDTARIPYGNKSSPTVIRYAIEGATCLIKHEIKLLVIACNTMSAQALHTLRQHFSIPIIGVIDAGAKAAASASHNKKIAVLGTRGTIQSQAYQHTIWQHVPCAKIFPIACPLFVHLVEEQWLQHSATDLIVKEYLTPLQGLNIDTLVLGCTHYPLLKDIIQAHMGANVTIVDSAIGCAQEVSRVLKEKQLQSNCGGNNHKYYVTDDPQHFCTFSKHVFGEPLTNVDLISFYA